MPNFIFQLQVTGLVPAECRNCCSNADLDRPQPEGCVNCALGMRPEEIASKTDRNNGSMNSIYGYTN